MEIKDRIKQLGRFRTSQSLFNVEHIAGYTQKLIKELTAYASACLQEPLKLRFMALERFSMLRLEQELVK